MEKIKKMIESEQELLSCLMPCKENMPEKTTAEAFEELGIAFEAFKQELNKGLLSLVDSLKKCSK